MGTGISGAPTGWQSNSHWSATPSAAGHALVFLNNGSVEDVNAYSLGYVALQVL